MEYKREIYLHIFFHGFKVGYCFFFGNFYVTNENKQD